MDGSDGLIPGALIGLFALGIGLLLVFMTYRFSRGRSIVMAMVQTSFLPEKRQQYLAILSLQGGVILLTGIAWGLTSQGWIPEYAGNTLVEFLLLGGALSVAAITYLGYSPARLTLEQRRSLASQAPAMFQSLVMAPLEAEAGAGTGFTGRSRTRVARSGSPKSTAEFPPRTPPPIA